MNTPLMILLKSISDIHSFLGYKKPVHPLITLINIDDIKPKENIDKNQHILDYFSILYNQNSLFFNSPKKFKLKTLVIEEYRKGSWLLLFHRNLIKGSSLERKIKQYHFFNTKSNRILLLEQEKSIINNFIISIKQEFSHNLDGYSNDLLISNLSTLFLYFERFSMRQIKK